MIVHSLGHWSWINAVEIKSKWTVKNDLFEKNSVLLITFFKYIYIKVNKEVLKFNNREIQKLKVFRSNVQLTLYSDITLYYVKWHVSIAFYLFFNAQVLRFIIPFYFFLNNNPEYHSVQVCCPRIHCSKICCIKIRCFRMW